MAAKRRQKGEGSITEYRKGHYRAFLDLGTDKNTGKRLRKTFTGSSKAEVIAKLNKAKYEKQEGLLMITKATPLFKYCDHFLDIKKTQIKPSTYGTYQYIIRSHILPFFGNKSLSDITTVDINTFISSKDMTKLNTSYRKVIKVILNGILQLAFKEGLINSNPTPLAESIKKTQNEITPLSKEEIVKLLEVSKSYGLLYYIVKLALETGMRRGELLGLHWSDIDFDKGTITIRRTLYNDQTIGTPKTDKSRRTIYVSKDTLKELLSIKKEGYEPVFTITGKYLKATAMYAKFKRMVQKAGLRSDIRFHDLRHTHATLLIGHGIDIKTVSERLGHSSVTVTLDRYTHVLKENDKKAAELVTKLI